MNKLLLKDLNPWLLGLSNSGIGAIFLFLFILGKGGFQEIRRAKGHLTVLIFIGLMGSLYNLGTLMGLKHSTAVNASILLRADIMFSIILGWVFLKERLSLFDFLGIGLMMLGSFLIMKIGILGLQFRWRGDSFFLLATLALSVNAMMIKRLLLDEIPGRIIAVFNATINVIFFATFTLILEQYHNLRFFSEREIFFLVPTLGLLTGITYLLYYGALTHIPIWLVRILMLLIPIFTAVIGYTILAEVINQGQLYGMILTIVGGILILYKQSKIFSLYRTSS